MSTPTFSSRCCLPPPLPDHQPQSVVGTFVVEPSALVVDGAYVVEISASAFVEVYVPVASSSEAKSGATLDVLKNQSPMASSVDGSPVTCIGWVVASRTFVNGILLSSSRFAATSSFKQSGRQRWEHA